MNGKAGDVPRFFIVWVRWEGGGVGVSSTLRSASSMLYPFHQRYGALHRCYSRFIDVTGLFFDVIAVSSTLPDCSSML
ncbi:hypothetical protein [Bacillus sp. FJAT-42315]|uniref:hypothetical protein n=1 Tax=Bacillus sp. FJAT-42315 TaxID=2014077 RepID=UPI000C233046|nr:hypothetical protein [Bacillus sp. FJAT-42315]